MTWVNHRFQILAFCLLAIQVVSAEQSINEQGQGTQATTAAACDPMIEINGFVPEKEPDKIIPGPKSCVSEDDMRAEAKRIACRDHFQSVSLIHAHNESRFAHSCFHADLAFYKGRDSMEQAPIQSDFEQTNSNTYSNYTVNPITSASTEGLELFLPVEIGAVASGIQDKSGLVSSTGDTATTNKMGLFLGFRYFFNENVGFEIQSGYLMSEAVAPNTKSMNFLDAWTTDIGVALAPISGESPIGLWEIMFEGGLNYTALWFDSDFKDFVLSNEGTSLPSSSATGIGWYGGAALHVLQSKSFTWGLGLRVRQESPTFPGASRDFAATSILLHLEIGCRPNK